MPDAATFPRVAPDPLRGHVPIPAPAAEAPFNQSSASSISANSSPLGLAKQYRHAPNLPSLHHQVSVTGATRNDPAGELARQPVLCDPDWASPMRGVFNVTKEYGVSFLTYWLGYGASLTLLIGLVQWCIGDPHPVPPSLLSRVLLVGPFYGFVFDFFLLASSPLYAFLGFLFLVSELALGFMFLITHEWRERLKYCGLLFGLVLLKAALIVWVNFRS